MCTVANPTLKSNILSSVPAMKLSTLGNAYTRFRVARTAASFFRQVLIAPFAICSGLHRHGRRSTDDAAQTDFQRLKVIVLRREKSRDEAILGLSGRARSGGQHYRNEGDFLHRRAITADSQRKQTAARNGWNTAINASSS